MLAFTWNPQRPFAGLAVARVEGEVPCTSDELGQCWTYPTVAVGITLHTTTGAFWFIADAEDGSWEALLWHEAALLLGLVDCAGHDALLVTDAQRRADLRLG